MISIIIPFHNEKENVPILQAKLAEVLKGIGKQFELVFVNDGSTDDSLQAVEKNAHTVLVNLRKQMGKGRALQRGIEASKGSIIVFMDADLEDNPEEVPDFINKIDEGYDFVNGMRKDRRHNGVIRLYSSLANGFIKSFLKSPFTDINCGFKAMKRDVVNEITLYGNNFRFLPLAAYYEGFKVTEIPVSHKQRIYGKSKFGMNKIFVGVFDTVTAAFIYRFAERPLHFFGIGGGITTIIGIGIMLYLAYDRIVLGHYIYRRPILFLGMMLVIVGFQVVATGLIGELLVYYHKKKS